MPKAPRFVPAPPDARACADDRCAAALARAFERAAAAPSARDGVPYDGSRSLPLARLLARARSAAARSPVGARRFFAAIGHASETFHARLQLGAAAQLALAALDLARELAARDAGPDADARLDAALSAAAVALDNADDPAAARAVRAEIMGRLAARDGAGVTTDDERLEHARRLSDEAQQLEREGRWSAAREAGASALDLIEGRGDAAAVHERSLIGLVVARSHAGAGELPAATAWYERVAAAGNQGGDAAMCAAIALRELAALRDDAARRGGDTLRAWSDVALANAVRDDGDLEGRAMRLLVLGRELAADAAAGRVDEARRVALSAELARLRTDLAALGDEAPRRAPTAWLVVAASGA